MAKKTKHPITPCFNRREAQILYWGLADSELEVDTRAIERLKSKLVKLGAKPDIKTRLVSKE